MQWYAYCQSAQMLLKAGQTQWKNPFIPCEVQKPSIPERPQSTLDYFPLETFHEISESYWVRSESPRYPYTLYQSQTAQGQQFEQPSMIK